MFLIVCYNEEPNYETADSRHRTVLKTWPLCELHNKLILNCYFFCSIVCMAYIYILLQIVQFNFDYDNNIIRSKRLQTWYPTINGQCAQPGADGKIVIYLKMLV